MFAKFSAIPASAQISSVTAPARTRGARLEKRVCDRRSRLIERDGRPCRRGRGSQNGGCERAQSCRGVGVAFWECLEAGATIGQYPIADKIARKGLDRHSPRIEVPSKQIEIMNERWNECGFGPGPGRGIRFREPLQQGGN